MAVLSHTRSVAHLPIIAPDNGMPGSATAARPLTRESTDEELARAEKQRKIAEALLGEQRLLAEAARLCATPSEGTGQQEGHIHLHHLHGGKQYAPSQFTSEPVLNE